MSIYTHISRFVLSLVASVAVVVPMYAHADTWIQSASMNNAHYISPTVMLPNGQILIAGGSDGTTHLSGASAELYDPAADTWTPTSSMIGARERFTATVLQNGKVLVVGGYDSNTHTILATVELYDPETGTWTSTGSLHEQRMDHVAALLPDGKVLVAGGYDPLGRMHLASAEIYDPTTGTWTMTNRMVQERTSPISVRFLDGTVLVAGGYTYNTAVIQSAEIYDPATGTWRLTGNMITPKYYHFATLLSDGRALVVGGQVRGGQPMTNAEVYDPTTGMWTDVAPMGTAREMGTATLLSDGKVLVAGGSRNTSGTDSLSNTEVYDPATNVWTPGAQMHEARSVHGAILLQDGSVLVTGGFNGTTQVASTEIYTASTTGNLPLEVTTQSLSEAVKNVAYSTTLSAANGVSPYTWSVASGTLPVGITLNPSTGEISGTPTRSGQFSVVVEVTDSVGNSASQALTVYVVNNVLRISTAASLPAGHVGDPYEKKIVAVGGLRPYASWTVIQGALPDGLNIDATGTISGTPTTVGPATFTLQVTDAAGAMAVKTFQMNVTQLHITTISMPIGKVGAAYSKTLAATGGVKPYTWSIVDGILPDGLILDPSGIVSGTPTTMGNTSVTVQVTDIYGVYDVQDFTIVVKELHVTTANIPNGKVGAAYTKTLAATGGVTPYTWAVVDGQLPMGIALSSSGVLSGVPTTAGTSTFTVRVTDANGQTNTESFDTAITQTAINTAALPNGKVGNAYSKTLLAIGGTTPYTWTVTGGSLPNGLSLSTDGVITGTPINAGTSTVIIRVSDANVVDDQQSFLFTIKP